MTVHQFLYVLVSNLHNVQRFAYHYFHFGDDHGWIPESKLKLMHGAHQRVAETAKLLCIPFFLKTSKDIFSFHSLS
jgi:hypothetical protein